MKFAFVEGDPSEEGTMSDLMTFPETWEEFERSYGFADKDEVYTNGSRLIQSFRVKQWLEHMKTADAVEVVRCEYCKHWDDFPIACESQSHECKFVDGKRYKIRIATPPDWFCPRGERRSE